MLYNRNAFKREPILAVVGQLQFDVVQARLQAEYDVPTHLERLPHILARWVQGPEQAVENLPARSEVIVAVDARNAWVALFSSPFFLSITPNNILSLRFVEITQI